MDIHVTSMTNKSWEAVYVIKVRQIFSKHRVSKIVSSVGWWTIPKKHSMTCYEVIDACTTSSDANANVFAAPILECTGSRVECIALRI